MRKAKHSLWRCVMYSVFGSVALFVIVGIVALWHGKQQVVPSAGAAARSAPSVTLEANPLTDAEEKVFKAVRTAFHADEAGPPVRELPDTFSDLQRQADELRAIYTKYKADPNIIGVGDQHTVDGVHIDVSGGKIVLITPMDEWERGNIFPWGGMWVFLIYDNGTCLRRSYTDTSQYLLHSASGTQCLIIESRDLSTIVAILFTDKGRVQHVKFTVQKKYRTSSYSDGTERIPPVMDELSHIGF